MYKSIFTKTRESFKAHLLEAIKLYFNHLKLFRVSANYFCISYCLWSL